MSAASRRCPACGADAPRAAARFCEQCGAELPASAPEPAPEPVPLPANPEEEAARFAALRAHPDLAARLETAPDVPELRGNTLSSALLLVLLVLAGLGLSGVALSMCPPLGLAVLLLVALGAIAVGRDLVTGLFATTTTQAVLIVAHQTQMQAGARHSHSNARHFVTLRGEDGAESEHEVLPSAVAGLEVGRMGVVYLNRDRVAAFAALPV